ncbi:MAG: phage tail protein [Sneathiella sp.]
MEFMPPLNPELPDGQYQDGDPANSVVGSIPPAEAIEHPMREIVHVIEQELGELAPTKNDLTQLYQAIQAMIDGGIGGSSFTGMIGHFATTAAPSGWLKADGSYVDKDTYSALHGIVGITYGPLVGNTFKLPDLRGEFIRSWSDGHTVDSGRTLGSWQKGTLSPVDIDGAGVWSVTASPLTDYVEARELLGVDDFDHTHYTNAKLSAVSGSTYGLPGTSEGTAGTTRPRNMAMLACIKI